MRKTCQQLIAVVITFIFVLSCGQIPLFSASAAWDGSVANSFEGGTGTQNDPYIIKTAAQLAYLAQNVNEGESYEGGYFKLAEDITLNTSDMFAYDENGIITGAAEGKTPYEWTPIGKSGRECFSGRFDGNGHIISGIYVNSSEAYEGLFGYCVNATVKNLGVVDGYMEAYADVGGIVGRNEADSGSSIVSNCYNACTVTSRLNGLQANAGGIVGYNKAYSGTAEVSNCYNTGAVSGSDEYMAGIVGRNEAYSTSAVAIVLSCRNAGQVNGDLYVGGVVGFNKDGSITDCLNEGEVSGGKYVGGIVGSSHNSSNTVVIAVISNCNNTGEVKGTDDRVGGIVGNSISCAVYGCGNKGNINGYEDVGGVVGYNDEGEVSGCSNTGAVSGGDNDVGGVVGDNRNGSVAVCANTGSVTSRYYVGGIAGRNRGSSGFTATVSDCYNSGEISGGNGKYIGGVVGENSTGATVSECYSIGEIGGSEYIGGIVGQNRVSGSEVAVRNCYYLSGTAATGCGGKSGNDTTAVENIAELTAVLMCAASSFVGFDFTDVWTMEGNPDYPYPELIGMEYGGEIANCEHVPGDWIISTAATCTDHGIKYRECTVCGVVLDIENIPMLGHDWGEWVQTIPPTESEEGEETRICKNDPSHIETRAIPRLGLKKGDPDGDGEITVADALTALRVAAKLAEETPFLISVCDIDNDGKITVSDALAILRVAAKLTDIL